MRAAGVSLIEALLALAVVSFGSLSAAALQLSVKRTHAGATQRALAARLAGEMAETLRAASSPARYVTATPLGRGSLGAEPQPDCSAGPCNEAQLAAHQRWQWEQALDGQAQRLGGRAVGGLVLPSACLERVADGEFRIVLAWREASAQPDRGAGPACGRDPQAGGGMIYSRSGNDNAYRRTLSLPITVATPRHAPGLD